MTVDVRFMPYLKSSAELSIGKKIVSIELMEGSAFFDLLTELERNFGPALAEEIYDFRKRSLRETVRATINGVLVHNLPDGEGTALREGDAIVFFPLVMGG